MVLAAVKTIFAQPSQEEARRVEDVAKALLKKSPKPPELLEEAADDVLADLAFPKSTGGRSTRPIHSSAGSRRFAGRRGSRASSPTAVRCCGS